MHKDRRARTIKGTGGMGESAVMGRHAADHHGTAAGLPEFDRQDDMLAYNASVEETQAWRNPTGSRSHAG